MQYLDMIIMSNNHDNQKHIEEHEVTDYNQMPDEQDDDDGDDDDEHYDHGNLVVMIITVVKISAMQRM